jgi:hypothetical protein
MERRKKKKKKMREVMMGSAGVERKEKKERKKKKKKTNVFGHMLFWCNFLAFAEVSARDWALQKWFFAGHLDQSLILYLYNIMVRIHVQQILTFPKAQW